MSKIGIYLSHDLLRSLSPATQEELRHHLFQGALESSESVAGNVSLEDDGGTPADFSTAQAVKLINGCSDRPKAALRFIANQASNTFSYKELMAEIGVDSSGTVRGTLSAITRRTRTVLGDPEADLIWWQGDDVATWTGFVSPMTHASLRKAFGIREA